MAPTSACHEVSTQTPGLKVFPASKNYAAIYKGFYYVHQKTGVDKHIMRCTRHNRGCHGKLHLTANYESLASTALAGAENHSHPAEPDYCELKYSVWKLKSAAKSSLEPTSAILAEQLANVSVEVQGSFPKISSLQRVVQRSRAASRLCKQTGSTPDSLVELPS
ncbi:uncharacterized protein LOC110861603 [Folsomia candida]|nr:uncharacterized protein LOC110861603 [Folsomia candida]